MEWTREFTFVLMGVVAVAGAAWRLRAFIEKGLAALAKIVSRGFEEAKEDRRRIEAEAKEDRRRIATAAREDRWRIATAAREDRNEIRAEAKAERQEIKAEMNCRFMAAKGG